MHLSSIFIIEAILKMVALYPHPYNYFKNGWIAIIVKKFEEAYKHIQQEFSHSVTQNEILEELKEIKRMMENLEKRIPKDKEKNIT